MGVTKRRFVLISFCILIKDISTVKIQATDNCPSDKSAWMQRENTFNCSGDKKYHCLLNVEESLYELCMKEWRVFPPIVGCPVVGGLETGNPQLALPYSKCPENITGCPQKGHDLYHTNELYKYPICFHPEDQRNESKPLSPTTVNEQGTAVTTPYSKDEGNKVGIVVPIVITLIIILTAAILSYIFRKKLTDCIRRNRSKRDTEEPITSEMHNLLNQDVEGEGAERYHNLNNPEISEKEWTSPCYQTLIKLKRTIWIHLEAVRGEKTWKDFFVDEHVKHALYHQWKNVICCNCQTLPEMYRKRFLSKAGWHSLYELCKKECPGDYDHCACKYSPKDIDVTKISLASLLCIVYTVGQLSRNGKRCVTEIRQSCEKIMQMKLSDVPEDVINDLQTLISAFEINSKYTAKASDDSDICDSESFAGTEHYTTDMGDLSPLEINEINEETLPKFTARTKEFLKEDPFYVSVQRWEDEVNRRITNDRFVIVTGHIGEGKSALCRQILKTFSSQEDVVALRLEPSQVKFQYLHQLGRPCLIYIEDFLGTSHYAKLYSKEKSSFYKDCLDSVNRYQNIRIICCVRSVVLEEAHSELMKCGDPSKYTMDLSSRWKLRKEEILHQLDKYQKEYKIVMPEDKKKDIANKASEKSFLGFEECCALCFKSNQGTRVFYHPETEVEKEISRLQDKKHFEFYILVYILLKNSPFNINSVDYDLLDKIDGAFALNSLKKRTVFTFLRKDADMAYTFQHQFILEAVLRVFGKSNCKELLSLASDAVVVRFLRPSTYQPRNEQEVFFCLQDDLDALLARKLLKASNYRNISIYVATKNKSFVHKHIISALEEILLVRQGDDSKHSPEKVAKFVENTIKDVVTEAVKEGNEVLLEALVQRYSDVSLGGKEGEVVVSARGLNGMTPLYQIARCFSNYLTSNIGILPSNIQQNASRLKQRFPNVSTASKLDPTQQAANLQ